MEASTMLIELFVQGLKHVKDMAGCVAFVADFSMQLTPFEHNIGDVGISTQIDANGHNQLLELKYLLILEIQVNLAYSTVSFLCDPPNYRSDLVQCISRNTHALSIDY